MNVTQMTEPRKLRTVAISEATFDELFALKHAFEGFVYPDDEEYAYDDELIAMMLGYHLRRIDRAPEKLARIVVQTMHLRIKLLKRDPSVVSRMNARRGIPEGATVLGRVLEANPLDADTLHVVSARGEMVADFARIAIDIMNSPAVVSKSAAIMSILRYYTDQQIIDVVAWAAFAHPLNGQVLENEYPEHIEDEIKARAAGTAKRLPLDD